MDFTRAISAISAFSLLFWINVVRAEDCGNGALDSSTSMTIEGVDWTVFYTDDAWADCGDDGDYYPQTQADKILPIIQGAYDRQGGWGFDAPWFTSLPDGNYYVFDSTDTGTNNNDCMTLDAKAMRCASDPGLRWVTSHELFHGVQRRYLDNAGADTALGSSLGAWFTEGTARTLDDRYDLELDAVGPFITDTNRLMTENLIKDDKDFGPYRDLTLFDLSYRACLFWGYCCEQLGTIGVEPDSGIDFILKLWQNMEDDISNNGVKDSLATLKRTIVDKGGGNLRYVFHDYATCLYTREFDATNLPNAGRYVFIDETTGLNGGSLYKDIIRSFTHDGTQPLPQALASSVKAWGQRVFELVPVPVTTSIGCRAVGLRGTSDKTVGWSLIGVQSSGGVEKATVLSKGVGTKYARAILNPGLNPMTRMGWVIVGFEDDASFKYTVDEGPVELSIVRPTFTWPVYPGPATDPGRILVRVFVEGPEGLKPEGAGARSIKGLTADDFAVSVEGDPAAIITSGYVGGEYWLVCQAPSKAADGLYDLTVQLCPGALMPETETEFNSVLYGDFDINHMLVIDRSGSMADPQGGTATKLDAARNAASLYIDAVNDNDRVGVAWFSGNNSECDHDADSISLATASGAQRTAAKGVVSGLTPSGWTSIGDGLWEAQDRIDAAALPAEDIKNIILLSDGDENEARFWTVPFACPGDLGDPADGRFATTDTFIHTIAFGPQSDQELMQDIADFTDGDYSYVDVEDSGKALTSLEQDLAEAYLTQLQEANDLERLFQKTGSAPSGVATTVFIPVEEAGVDQGAFVLNWSQSAGAMSVELRDPNSNLIGAGQAQIYSDATHVVYHVNGTLMTGTWTLRMTPTSAADYLAVLLGRQRFGAQMITQVSQERTGCGEGVANYGSFEQGVPVHVQAILTDAHGPIRGAAVTAIVLRPDGTFACGKLVLTDDGAQDDGQADDGVYAALFTDTWQAGVQGGVVNDDPNNPPPPGVSGSYTVFVVADGTGNLGQDFTRYGSESFHVYVAPRTDLDEDGLPCTWETYYGTDPTVDDAAKDYDGDGLDNTGEFKNGTNPFDQDTDNGGESDGSEVQYGRCPLDPTDDELPCPQDVGVVTDTGDLNEQILVPNGLILWFPVHPSYQSMRIYRADELAPTNFVLIANPATNDVNDGTYTDLGLVDGRTYYYRFQAVGLSGELSCTSRTVQGVAFADAIPPLGWVDINNGSERTDSASVLLTLNFSTGADQYRISNTPFDDSEPYLPLPLSPYLTRLLDAVAQGGQMEVFVQYVNSVTGRESEVYRGAIFFDPDGDFDSDATPNTFDPDDDGDGVNDVAEVFTHHTDAFKVDSDEDGVGDGVEISGGCTHPRNPDTDGDGMLDGVDPSPAADTDSDNDVDLFDFSVFAQCFTGADNGPVMAACFCLDFDGDDDIDEEDYVAFGTGLSGP